MDLEARHQPLRHSSRNSLSASMVAVHAAMNAAAAHSSRHLPPVAVHECPQAMLTGLRASDLGEQLPSQLRMYGQTGGRIAYNPRFYSGFH